MPVPPVMATVLLTMVMVSASAVTVKTPFRESEDPGPKPYSMIMFDSSVTVSPGVSDSLTTVMTF